MLAKSTRFLGGRRLAPHLISTKLVIAVVLTLLCLGIISASTSPGRGPRSCGTLESCLWGGASRSGEDLASAEGQSPSSAAAATGAPRETEETLKDGTMAFTRYSGNNGTAKPEILFLTLTKDARSWGGGDRGINDFLKLVNNTSLDLSATSLGLMTASTEQFELMKRAVRESDLALARTTILMQESRGPNISYEHRHDEGIQSVRRSHIASLRNYLMLRALRDEAHVIWLDADVVELSQGIVQTMVVHAEAQPDDVGILHARCAQGGMSNYDKNAWRVGGEDRSLPWPQLGHSRILVDDLLRDTADDDLVALDSVGGTILYIRASLVWQGVNFPTYEVVGTTWAKKGDVGVETEGICYVASSLKGGGCYLLGGGHHASHGSG